VQFGALWLAGIDLRVTLLCVPPVIPLLHRDLHLSETAVGALAGAPVLLLGLAATPGALVIARLGAKRALVLGIAIVAVSSALRGAGTNAPMLFAMTLLMGAGIAGMQPAFPALVHEWYPSRITAATGVWTNGLLAGEALAASLTIPLVLPLARGSWAWSFVIWAIPVALSAVLVARLTPPDHHDIGDAPRAWVPNWGDKRLWQIGVFQCSASLIYFGANAFIPDYLQATKQGTLIEPALTALNVGQLPASLVIGLLPWRIIGRAGACVAIAALVALALAGFLLVGGWPAVCAAAIFGFCAAYILALSFALPAMVVEGPDVARMSAGVFTVSYLLAFAATVGAGAAWDATHVLASAFVPLAAAVVILLGLGPIVTRSVRSARR